MKPKTTKSNESQLGLCHLDSENENEIIEKNSDQSTEDIEADSLKSLIKKVKSGMLTITFDQSNNQYNKNAVEIARELFSGVVKNDVCWVLIPDKQIIEKSSELFLLTSKIRNFKSLKALFRCREIDLQLFLNRIKMIKNCAFAHSKNPHMKYCWQTTAYEGWGCKFITSVKRHIQKSKTIVSESYWYNRGHFNDLDEWIIDKEYLKIELMAEADTKGIFLCPHFDKTDLLSKINQLPSKIKPDNFYYKVKYKSDFVGDKIGLVPYNISHCDLDKERSEFSSKFRLKLDNETGYRFSDN